jgi:hypothetical protein
MFSDAIGTRYAEKLPCSLNLACLRRLNACCISVWFGRRPAGEVQVFATSGQAADYPFLGLIFSPHVVLLSCLPCEFSPHNSRFSGSAARRPGVPAGRCGNQEAKGPCKQMNRKQVLSAVAGLLISAFTACGGGTSTGGNVTTPPSSFHETSQDPSGTLDTFSHQKIDRTGPFFASLGSNDRSCASCHDSADGWSVTPAHLQQRFNNTQGTDPIFRTVDGANCPSDDVSTLTAATSSYSQLLDHGLIRMTLPVPANAEFSIVAITDPYQCPETTATSPALYRRPLPSTNLKFLNGIMWDGREPDLKTQALDATLVHTQPSGAPTDAQLQQIVNLESLLFTAQSVDSLAGDLTAQGAKGGPEFLSALLRRDQFRNRV